MKTVLKTTVLFALMAATQVASASYYNTATWTGAGANGHKYEIFEQHTKLTWSEASQKAKDLGGHLVTITSQAESNWLFTNLVDDSRFWNGRYGAWIGAYQKDETQGSLSTENWNWVTGEAWSFETWNGYEPNDAHGYHSEAYAHFWKKSNSWNDLKDKGDNQVSSYVVEYGISEVPVPAAAFLFAPALLGFMGLRRKAKKAA